MIEYKSITGVKITHVESGKVLTRLGFKITDEFKLDDWQDTDHQKWSITYLRHEKCYIAPIKHRTDVLDVWYGNYDEGTRVVLGTYADKWHQYWNIVKVRDSGEVVLVTHGFNFRLTFFDPNHPVIASPAHGDKGQLFRIEAIESDDSEGYSNDDSASNS